jgi:hypothetical protein
MVMLASVSGASASGGSIHGSGCSGSHQAEGPGMAVRAIIVKTRQLRLMGSSAAFPNRSV